MKNRSKSSVIKDQLVTILNAWGIKADIPVRGDFNISIIFPGSILNKGRIKKTDRKSTYNKPLYEIDLFSGNIKKDEHYDFISINGLNLN